MDDKDNKAEVTTTGYCWLHSNKAMFHTDTHTHKIIATFLLLILKAI